ncbi:MAG: TetR/AcrR family transcriptional regulator [Gemmatimonadaceae bacterium]
MGPRERKAREFNRREQEILSAALALFKGDSWHTVTIDQIAQATEIGKGTIYKHFQSKDEIYARLALDFQTALIETLRQVDPGQGVIARLRQSVQAFWQAHVDAGSEHRRVLEYCEREDFVSALPERTRQRHRRIANEVDTLLAQVLEAGISQRLFPRKPIELLIFDLRSTLFGAIHRVWSYPLSAKEAELYLEEITNFILAGMMYQGRVTNGHNVD